MPEKISDNTWVYTVIKDPGSGEQFLGQHESETDISYIPIFLEKEHATQGLLQLEVEKGTRCEVQAVIYSDIDQTAGENGFLLYLLDESGNVLDKIAPTIREQ
jgi:hypothetical protein